MISESTNGGYIVRECEYCKEQFEATSSTSKVCPVCRKHKRSIERQTIDNIRRFNRTGSYEPRRLSHFFYRKRTKEEVEYDLKTSSKVCTLCEERKPFSKFYSDTSSLDGRITRCKSCVIEMNKVENINRELYDARRIKYKKKTYNLSDEDYNNLMEIPHCQICGKVTENSLHIDHCHSTGKVRGMLCADCNLGLGKFKDDPDLLLKAINYLNTQGSKQ